MSNKFFSIDILKSGITYFKGYFVVNVASNPNLITAFYDFSQPIGPNQWANIFTNDGLDLQDNIFYTNTLQFSFGGVNIVTTNNSFFKKLDTNNQANLYFRNLNQFCIDTFYVIIGDQGPNFINQISYYDFNTIIQEIPDPSCFNENTKILCLNKDREEVYIPIQNLRKGDLVKCLNNGYRKVDLIGKNTLTNEPHLFNYCMYIMHKTDKNDLIEDLIVTGGQGILVDEITPKEKMENELLINGETPKIEDKYMLISAVHRDFVKLMNNDEYTYYHFTIENDGNDDQRYAVWANGLLCETPSKNQFKEHPYIILI
jgi:hypothetical protein